MLKDLKHIILLTFSFTKVLAYYGQSVNFLKVFSENKTKMIIQLLGIVVIT